MAASHQHGADARRWVPILLRPAVAAIALTGMVRESPRTGLDGLSAARRTPCCSSPSLVQKTGCSWRSYLLPGMTQVHRVSSDSRSVERFAAISFLQPRTPPIRPWQGRTRAYFSPLHTSIVKQNMTLICQHPIRPAALAAETCSRVSSLRSENTRANSNRDFGTDLISTALLNIHNRHATHAHAAPG
jgi:hypothetical protein